MKRTIFAVLVFLCPVATVLSPLTGLLHSLENGFDPYADADKGVQIPEGPSLLPEEEIEAGTRNELEYGDSMYEDWGSELPDDDPYDLDKIENPERP